RSRALPATAASHPRAAAAPARRPPPSGAAPRRACPRTAARRTAPVPPAIRPPPPGAPSPRPSPEPARPSSSKARRLADSGPTIAGKRLLVRLQLALHPGEREQVVQTAAFRPRVDVVVEGVHEALRQRADLVDLLGSTVFERRPYGASKFDRVRVHRGRVVVI